MTIPKVIIQTSVNPPDPKVVSKLKKYTSGWEYIHFNDKQVLEFFLRNPDERFSYIVKKYLNIKIGAHRADLFRYYYLYKKGGVFLDSDAMLNVPLDNIIKNYNFVSVQSGMDEIFQGFLCAEANHDLLFLALCHAYFSKPEEREDYKIFCRALRKFITVFEKDSSVHLYTEGVAPGADYSEIINDNGDVLLMHYFKNKIIPL